MKKIEKRVKQYRTKAILDWVDSQTKDFSEEQKAKIYPFWINLLKNKGEEDAVLKLEKDLQTILDNLPKPVSILVRLKSWFKKIFIKK